MPTPFLRDDRISVLFTTRDAKGISRITVRDFDFDFNDITPQPQQGPVLDIGLPGTFDQHGVMSSSIVRTEKELLLYYIGWDTETEYPYSLSIGLAASKDWNSGFVKVDNPVLGSNFDGGTFSTTPYVWNDSENLNMLYSKGKSWIKHDGKFESSYGIASVKSQNGMDWTPSINFGGMRYDKDSSYARPTMVEIEGEKHILYSERSNIDFRTGAGSYKIRIARIISDTEWAGCKFEFERNSIFQKYLSRMQCYAHPLNINGKTIIFMNGDDFGKLGFAVAEVLS
jgi:hypothetical protein